jgi:hypothetical protein
MSLAPPRREGSRMSLAPPRRIYSPAIGCARDRPRDPSRPEAAGGTPTPGRHPHLNLPHFGGSAGTGKGVAA